MARTRPRARGEGSIRIRADGRAEARYYGLDGKQHSITGPTREAVAAKLAVALQRKREGRDPQAAGRLTFGAFVRDWLDNVHQPRVEPASWARYDSIYRVHLAPQLGHLRLSQVGPRELQAYFTKLYRAGQAASTLRAHRGLLSKAFTTAVRWGYVDRNPVVLVEMPKVERTEPAALEADAVAALLAAAAGDWAEALIVLAVDTGMRIGELLGLSWKAVDWRHHRLRVDQQLIRLRGGEQHGALVNRKPKSWAGLRVLPLSPRAVAALAAHKKRQAEQRLAWGSRWQVSDRIFTGQHGQPLQHGTAAAHLAIVAKRAGLGHITPHDLRRTFSSTALNRGADLAVVSRLMGHSRVTMTMLHYRAMLTGDEEQAASKAWEALGALEEHDSADADAQ